MLNPQRLDGAGGRRQSMRESRNKAQLIKLSRARPEAVTRQCVVIAREREREREKERESARARASERRKEREREREREREAY